MDDVKEELRKLAKDGYFKTCPVPLDISMGEFMEQAMSKACSCLRVECRCELFDAFHL